MAQSPQPKWPDLSEAVPQVDDSHTMGNALRWMLIKKYVLLSNWICACSLTPFSVQKSSSVVTGASGCSRPLHDVLESQQSRSCTPSRC